jgi:hypothetical protein
VGLCGFSFETMVTLFQFLVRQNGIESYLGKALGDAPYFLVTKIFQAIKKSIGEFLEVDMRFIDFAQLTVANLLIGIDLREGLASGIKIK